MAAKSITLTVEEIEKRIAVAARSLSRKKFTEKQLKQIIVNGKIPGENKRTKSGYQLYLDEFRKDLSKEERAQVGKVAKNGGAAWKALDDDEKAPFLDKAAKLREDALADKPVKEKKPRGRPAKKVEVSDSDAEEDEPKTPPKPKKKAAKKSKKTPEPVADSDAEDEPKTPPKPKKAKKSKKTPEPVADSDAEDEPKTPEPVADSDAEDEPKTPPKPKKGKKAKKGKKGNK